MEIITSLGGIGSAFGLSASAGLNAYIPLLVVALTARFTNLLNLSEPYNVIESWPVIAVLSVLLLIEMFVDKVPAIDTLNDGIQTFIRPAAGAVMFAANANVITDVSPVIAVIAGILLAGTVHTTKSVVRPAVTGSTAGLGNPFVSFFEDVIAFCVSIMAIFVPILIGIIVFIVIVMLLRRYYRKRKLRPVL